MQTRWKMMHAWEKLLMPLGFKVSIKRQTCKSREKATFPACGRFARADGAHITNICCGCLYWIILAHFSFFRARYES